MPTPDNKREEMARDVGQKRDQTPFQDNNKREGCKCGCEGNNKFCDMNFCSEECKRYNTDPFLEKTLSEFDEKWSTDMISGGFLSIKEEADFYPNKETMKSFIRSALNAQREEIREKIEIMLRTNSAYMFPATEERFINDLRALLSPHNKENE